MENNKDNDNPKNNNDKGKDKEQTDVNEEHEPSIMSRLQDSARMAGATFVSARAALPDMPSTMDGKTIPAELSASGPGYQNALEEAPSSSATRPVRKTAASESFRRPPQGQLQASTAYDTFTNTHQTLPDVCRLQLQPHTETHPGSHPPATTAVGGSLAEVEATDGFAVVNLLSQPGDISTMPPDEEWNEVISPETDAKLRAALFNSGSSGRLPWDHLLNFTPDFISAPNPTGQSRTQSQAHLGTSDQDAAADMWLHQWHDVLSSYTDEIWGDVGPLVGEARREVETDLSTESSERTETPALSRLRMILAHIRGVP